MVVVDLVACELDGGVIVVVEDSVDGNRKPNGRGALLISWHSLLLFVVMAWGRTAERPVVTSSGAITQAGAVAELVFAAVVKHSEEVLAIFDDQATGVSGRRGCVAATTVGAHAQRIVVDGFAVASVLEGALADVHERSYLICAVRVGFGMRELDEEASVRVWVLGVGARESHRESEIDGL
jgi:hypothetical protein